jgi:hypothetical protein
MSERSVSSKVAVGILPALAGALLLSAGDVCVAQEPAPAVPPALVAPAPASATAAGPCVKIWISHEAEYEELLRSAPVERVEKLSLGVTHSKHVFFGPGLPFSSAAFKPLMPGRYAGFQESYRSEIAAYELDKLLELHMVPPVVERKVKGETGAAVMWVENVKGWDAKANIRGPDKVAWARELVCMKMFDALIGNIDRNEGNLLYDAEYHIILIDHSRAFTDVMDMTKFQKFLFVDRPLWERMQALTIESVQPAVGKWVSKGMLLAMLQRRDRLQKEVDQLHAARGETIWLK